MSNRPLLGTRLNLDEDLVESSVIHKNVGQEFVVTTADKIRICLRDYQAALKARQDWTTPFGVLLALVASLVAADFQAFLGLAAEVWEAVFVVGSIASFGWLVYTTYWAIVLRKASDIEQIIEKLKAAE